MNHKITQVFVPTSVETVLGTEGLGKQVMGVYNPNTFANIGGTTADADFLLAIGSAAVGSKYGSFKTSNIRLGNILSVKKTVADTTSKQQITYIGYDEVNDTKSPSFSCDEDYTLTLRIDEYWSRGVYNPFIQESVSVKTSGCSECGGNCDELGCYPFMLELVNKVNANALLSKYVEASLVSKGSAPTNKYTLTLPDPGTSVGGLATVVLDTTAATGFTNGSYTAITQSSTSGSGTGATFNFTVAGGILTAVAVNAAGSGYAIGEVITFLGTKITGGTTTADDFTITVVSTNGPEGALLDALKTYYAAATYGAITITADTDGDADTNSTGNIMFEIVTPLITDINAMPAYNGIAWESVASSAGSVTACGIKLTGKALDEFGNACVPDAVPYVFNLVRFQAVVHKGPFTTMSHDLPSVSDAWTVTTTQNIKYPIGVGEAIAELERHFWANNLPDNIDARRYSNPLYNEDVNQFLYVDKTTTYDMYEITYLEDSPVGFEVRSKNEHSVLVLAASGVTAAVTTALNNVLPTALHV